MRQIIKTVLKIQQTLHSITIFIDNLVFRSSKKYTIRKGCIKL